MLQLIKAVALRQRLRTTYEHAPPPAPHTNPPPLGEKSSGDPSSKDKSTDRPEDSAADKRPRRGAIAVDEQHEHSYPEEGQSYDSDTGVRKKRCPCGFVLSLEEM